MKENTNSDPYHPVYPSLDDRHTLSLLGDLRSEQPKPEDFENEILWQLAYDEWYKQRFGNCPNFCGHF